MNASGLLGINTTNDIGAILDSLLSMKTGGFHILPSAQPPLSQREAEKNIRSLLSGETCNAKSPLAPEPRQTRGGGIGSERTLKYHFGVGIYEEVLCGRRIPGGSIATGTGGQCGGREALQGKHL